MNPNIILLSGIPASGKSTYAKELSVKTGYVIECADTWRGKLSPTGDEGDQTNTNEIFFSILPREIKKHLDSGKGVIIDVTGVNKKARKIWVEFAKKNKYSIECHWFRPDVSKSLLWNKKRFRRVPEDIIVKYGKKYSPPKVEEGFSKIFEIKTI